MSEAVGISQLGALLGALGPKGPPPSPREVAELLWLAANLPGGAVARRGPESQAVNAATAAELPAPSKAEEAAEDTPGKAEADGAPEQDARLYLPEANTPGGER